MAVRDGCVGRRRVRSVLAWTSLSFLQTHLVRGETLLQHTISTPPNIQSLASFWHLAGTVIPSTQGLYLSAGIQERIGMLWSMSPLLTNDFEAKFEFNAKGPEPHVPTGDGIAIWYVNENATAITETAGVDIVHNQAVISNSGWVPQLADKHGLGLFGYRNTYDGLGVFLTDTPSGGEPTLVAIVNNGKTKVQMDESAFKQGTLKSNFHGNAAGKDFTVTLRVEGNKAKVELSGAGSVEMAGDFKPGGYLGLTIYAGNPQRTLANKGSQRSDVLMLKSLKVENFDKSKSGETAMPEIQASPVPTEEKEDLLHATSSFTDHRAESDAIKELTNMVFKLVVESQPVRKQMGRAIETLTSRIEAMEGSFKELKEQLDKKSGHHLSEEFDNLKRELSSLSTVAEKETVDRHSRIDSLHQDIADVHKSAKSPSNIDDHLNKLTESSQRTLTKLSNEHHRMYVVSIAAIAFIVVAGLALYNKFHCWEKKHVL